MDTTSETRDIQAEDAARPPRTKLMRRKFTSVRLAPELVERQGKIARLAFEALGSGATEFLNTHHDALGGRPLDVAMGSAEGMAAVTQAIAARKTGG